MEPSARRRALGTSNSSPEGFVHNGESLLRGLAVAGVRFAHERRRVNHKKSLFAVRISGGGARGITLQVPKGDLVRPATDGMRQAVFSSLAARLGQARFLDLFAGSGAYGLEALSRGAAGGFFVERNAKAIGCLRHNLSAVCKSLKRGEEDLGVAQADVLDWAAPSDSLVPDLVFIDPPYDIIEEMAPKLFLRLSVLLTEKLDPVIVFEMPGEMTLSPIGWTCVKRLGKGVRQPSVAFFKKAGVVAAQSASH